MVKCMMPVKIQRGSIGTEEKNAESSGVAQFDNGAIVAERIAGAKSGDRAKNFVQRALAGHRLEAEVFEEVTVCVLGFGHAVGDHDQLVARFQPAVSALISGVFQK